MCNTDLREYAKNHKVKLWKIADSLGITDTNFSKKLRYELSPEKKKEIFAIIDELATVGGTVHGRN